MKKNVLIVYIVLGAFVLLGSYYTLIVAYKNNAAKNPPASAQPNKNENAPDEQQLSPHLRLRTPVVAAAIASPLVVSGEAAGWYFEATFPVKLLDANGKTLAAGQARATSDWMTADFVPFTATLDFTAPATPTGTLVLKNDNPSGDPSRDEIVNVPVRFSAAAACVPTGCSGQICSDQNVITDCLYLPAYACYKNAKCERQSDGACGWTDTPSLKACLGAGK